MKLTNLDKENNTVEAQNMNSTHNQIQKPPSGEPHQRDMTPNPNVKRYMPVMPKKGIFNEWGAVLRHQDEMEREQERQEFQMNKVRQEEYRKSLENQIKYQQDQYVGMVSSHKGQDEEFVKDQWKREQKRIKKEESEVIRKKQHAVNIAKETMQNNQILRQQVQAVKQTENDVIRDQLIHSERQELKRMETQRATKKNNQTSMKHYLDQQTVMKNQQQHSLKSQDKIIAKLGIEKEEQEAKRRNEYFERLQKFQDRNDLKTQSLIKYMKDDPKSLAETRDKKMYLEGIAQEQKKWEMRDNEENKRRQHDTEVLKSNLNNQINERSNNQLVNKKMEQYYGQMLVNKDKQDYERELSEQQKFRNQQKVYFNSLNDQVRQATNRKRFSEMMTDQERKLNQKGTFQMIIFRYFCI